MKKKWYIVFVALCLLLCVAPFAGMAAFRTDTTTENKRLAELPSFWENGAYNPSFLKELGAYFEDRFAFRQLLVSADAEIQSKVFGVSHVDTVIRGTDGWLYYKASLDDYLGQNILSEREVFNAAHNLSLLRQYAEDRGAAFLFTVAPNKNSLYGEHMPYYYRHRVSDVKNVARLRPLLEAFEVPYLDLFSLFASQNEELYLKRDSHWNQKGALLVYNALLDALQWRHDRYDGAEVTRAKTEIGDLNKMLYPLTAVPEWNYSYRYDCQYSYVTPTESVEDAWIQTVSPRGDGSLLMFRDSFGNSLLPFLADACHSGYFSKATPYNIAAYMELYRPDAVVVEIVERNLWNLAEGAPVMPGPETVLQGQTIEATVTNSSVSAALSETNTAYLEIGGVLDPVCAGTETKIYVKVTVGDSTHVYEAFTLSAGESDYGYLLYLPKDALKPAEILRVETLSETNGLWQSVCAAEFMTDELLAQTITG